MTLNLDPLARPLWRGRTNVDQITAAAIEYAETLRRVPGAQFVCTQGSYQGGGGEPLSAGTHDLGGVVDLRWTGDEHDIWALRAAGFAAWHRTPAQGPWPDHIHAVLIDHPRLADSADRQVASYRAGRNGLKNNGPDDGPRISPIPIFTWPLEDPMAEYADQLNRIEKNLAELAERETKRAKADRERAKARHLRVLERLDGLAADVSDDASRAQVRALRNELAHEEPTEAEPLP